jgi:type IV pilus assembly protein PilB
MKAAPALRKPPGSKSDTSIEGSIKRLMEGDAEGSEDSVVLPEESADSDAPMILLVNAILSQSVVQGASDVHVEPLENMLRVRYRVDGVLREVQRIPHKLASGMVTRLKVMAGLDICERRVPQDGSFKLKENGVEAEFRMSSLPSQFGEKIVLRVMGSASVTNDLSKLSIPDVQLKLLRQALRRPDGLVLVTGPTGSGKTTTLYAALNELNEISVSVFTAEDPIEGTLQGVTQCQANAAVGYTFATMLRSFLRQDPDVILVGEIRDQETAEISIKAALTGHLVLSTLHTNCAVSTIQRLVNMGVAPYLITTAVSCIVAQRLVRRICGSCKEPTEIAPELLEQLGSAGQQLQGETLYLGRGCKQCSNTGYRGRAPLYEVLMLSDELRAAILHGASREQLKALALARGMISLRQAGLDLVRQGITSIEEVLGASTEDAEAGSVPLWSPQQQVQVQYLAAPVQAQSAGNVTQIHEIESSIGPAAPIAASASAQAVSRVQQKAALPAESSKSAAGPQRWKALRTAK